LQSAEAGGMMLDLLTKTETPYLAIYESLQEVMETFHREGRISDANAKLDETVKFLAIHYGFLKSLVDEEKYHSLLDRKSFSVGALNSVFAQIASAPVFSRPGMGSIFGTTPSTVFDEGDENIAYELFRAAGRAFDAQASQQHQLDVLNEAFGHHVRDNFRSHIEDAQYMTPPEVVSFMVDMAMELIPNQKGSDTLVVADPSCGVGSFLTNWRAAYTKVHGNDAANKVKCIGQDKVDRMVRLSAINMIFSESINDNVFMGNTVQDGSPISNYDGKIDLILTNPPFGARFSVETLQHTSRKSTPFFAKKLVTSKIIDSELLFIDRYLTLLKPGGICLVVVPDGVISAKGTSSILRQHLSRSAELVAVVELPPVTFAQAGTRTKTAVLAFKKVKPRNNYPVLFAEAHDLGFQVSKRKGVTVKKTDGVNELPSILEAFQAPSDKRKPSKPSENAVWKELNPSSCEAWTPRTMLFDKTTLEDRSPYRLVALKDLLLHPCKRKATAYSEEFFFISVLHVIGEGIMDIPGIKSYQPVTPGIPVEPGEIILSRINPRIPRVAVVPDLGRKLLCSSEYEIMRPKPGVSPYYVAFMLLSSFVQEQIQSLTAGTSASHSRIKPKKVYEALVPDLLAVDDVTIQGELRRYEQSCKAITSSLIEIENLRRIIKV
jgi:type I restriction-modification system DNA methylase subunit